MLRSQSPITLSNKTRLFTFSLLFPLDHFFFLPLLELAAALAMASLDLSGTLGGCFVVFRSVSRTFLLRLRHQYAGSVETLVAPHPTLFRRPIRLLRASFRVLPIHHVRKHCRTPPDRRKTPRTRSSTHHRYVDQARVRSRGNCSTRWRLAPRPRSSPHASISPRPSSRPSTGRYRVRPLRFKREFYSGSVRNRTPFRTRDNECPPSWGPPSSKKGGIGHRKSPQVGGGASHRSTSPFRVLCIVARRLEALRARTRCAFRTLWRWTEAC